ncbi:MAG: hypothetical protein H0U73_02850 [Tatlockia sp.]|nr:hypothetical protein [Tatlockia sp.]
MNFEDWCFKMYGISSFSEGKIINRVFIPAKEFCYLDSLIVKCRGYLTIYQHMKGLTLTQKSYGWLERNLSIKFDCGNDEFFDQHEFEKFKKRYFDNLGFDLSRLQQHRVPPGVHIKIEDEQARKNFTQLFAHYKPYESFDHLTKNSTVQMPAKFLKHLYASYYKNIKPVHNLNYLLPHKWHLEKLLSQIEIHKLHTNLDSTHDLSLDYDNKNFSTIEAVSSYALSLKMYAELHRNGLSTDDYNLLCMTASLLVAYHDAELKQSLKTDVIFVNYIKSNLYPSIVFSPVDEYPLIANLPNSKQIFKMIDENVENLLYGNPNARLDGGSYFSTYRFLPDINNCSDTDELILNGGGMRSHFAIYRLIKVPMLANGQILKANEKPHHYAYFKVENNLGMGCNFENYQLKTCLGTYVTQIMPYTRVNDEWLPVQINPCTYPEEYQAAMEDTLKELMRVERQLLFYRKPDHIKTILSSVPGSEEGNEWQRLHQIKVLLSGSTYFETVRYIARDVVDSSSHHECYVENQIGYIQEGGSCPVFSVKSFVISILGPQLATLITHFMQHHRAQDYVRELKNEIRLTNKEIKQQKENRQSTNNNHFFKITQNFADSRQPELSERTLNRTVPVSGDPSLRSG